VVVSSTTVVAKRRPYESLLAAPLGKIEKWIDCILAINPGAIQVMVTEKKIGEPTPPR